MPCAKFRADLLKQWLCIRNKEQTDTHTHTQPTLDPSTEPYVGPMH